MAVYSPKMRSLELLSSSCKPQNFDPRSNWWSNTNRPLLTLKITVFGEAEVRPTTAGFEKKHSTRFWPKRALIHNRQRQGWRRGKIQWPKKMWREKNSNKFLRSLCFASLNLEGTSQTACRNGESGKTCPITKQMKEGTSFRPYSSSKTTCLPSLPWDIAAENRSIFQEITGKLQDRCVRSYRQIPASSFHCHHLPKKASQACRLWCLLELMWADCWTVLVSTGKPFEWEFSRNKFRKETDLEK